ncbi:MULTISPECIES: YgiW/YdeI family stress tolerance OB fold protein [unclassified Brenneria]|uniref:YgiW/YdeI family stress tolerance OB fold protein n=1 Tax=unclassified Brenneria TaxID=2634434 RepID=UPI001556B769|nr:MULTISPECIES: YgiW/YdeI family stress tolerance OB fold protein [unclassified Brenneria]MBJ7222296.1 YgiW/YdeI family stress tolerance OB fold protein [Brenneria sp. L3-3C-1]MEE3643539.1 YgiW/YdeI family stress tolerance OB fold protein [Brenneria sp. L3_3C_1]MEE3651723.1 YgiW/YdeI family stress tolerance OB fold protein [Brenneria sp. HEZEL_4_2_4]NPD01679.1 YgiW/YdeI family stress tolerance OB fold protein [Brenneria sp. hezel4-2-4]
MKKTAAVFAIAALCAAPVFAAQTGGFVDPKAPAAHSQNAAGGFIGPQGSVTTVAKAKEMKDDSWVILQGTIEQRIGGEDYLFRDESGTITVEIDDKYWNGQTITPQDKVELQGELDKGFSSAELDVKQVRKIQ